MMLINWKHVQSVLSSLKGKADKLDTGKLETALVDLSKSFSEKEC